uniref:Circadian oscillating protein COP23 n=1 Tax=Cyanothece sp. (strain PCC 7425 / ATCC 29141) TaxID=395961 RepID=B8HP26_CYAP4
MFKPFLTALTTGCTLAWGLALGIALLPTHSVQAQGVKFFCDEANAIPTTTARTAQGNVAIIRWASTLGDNYDPLTRCRQVSARFQSFYDQRLLRFLTTGRMNGQNVVCVALKRGEDCIRPNGLLFTLKPGSNPRNTLLQLVNVSNKVGGPLYESSAERVYLDMDQVLNPPETIASPSPEPAPTSP